MKSLEQVAALAAGLGVAVGAEQAWIVEMLASLAGDEHHEGRWAAIRRRVTGVRSVRTGPAAARALVAGWLRLSEDLQALALREAGEAVVEAARRRTPPGAPEAAVARDSREPRLMAAMEGLLAGDAADMAEEAVVRIAAGVSGVADAWIGLSPGPELAPRVANGWNAASEGLVRVLRRYSGHRRPGALLAAAVMLGPGALAYGGKGDGLVGWLAEKEDAAHLAMRTALRKSVGVVWRLRAWEWLKRDEVGAAAMERVARAERPEEHAAVLERSHLLANPARARRAALITARAGKGPSGVMPAPEAVPSLPVEARRGLPRFAAALRLATGALDRAVAPLLGDHDAQTRFLAVRALEGERVSERCWDPDGRIAGSATLRCAARGWGEAAMARLTGSPHPWVRRLAREEAARTDPWAPACERSRIAAHRALTADRPAFLTELRHRIESGAADARVAAIMLARRLELQAQVELELLAAATSESDERAAATATAALGEAGTASALEAVRRLTGHATDRVRANAVEGMVRRLLSPAPSAEAPDAAVYAAAIELKNDGHHRVRANAIRGLLVSAHGFEPAAAEELASMLGDQRPLHRLAGLWAVERVLLGPAGDEVAPARWNEWAARVAGMAREEPEGPVRARAMRCALRMLGRMRSGWERRAVGLEGATT